MDTRRLPVREPYTIPDDEFEGMDDQDIAEIEKANNGELDVPDSALSPADLAQVKARRKAHDY